MQEYTFPVYLGVWINWSYGRILGATLTLTSQQGNLLVAFLALFVTAVGTSFWRISCFLIHLTISTKGPRARDGLYHQHQAILRNSANATHGLLNISWLCWAWRRAAQNTYLRTLPTIIYSAACICTFALASGFSSRVAKGFGTEVLISNSFCQTPSTVNSSDISHRALFYSSLMKSAFSQAAYAQQCYWGNSSGISGTLSCSTLINRNFTIHTNRSSGCPFSGDICSTKSSNLFFDTGFLDSNHDLGLNAPSTERFLYRKTAHCAPLKTEGRKRDANDSRTVSTEYYFGTTDYSFGDIGYSNWTVKYDKNTAKWAHMPINSKHDLGCTSWLASIEHQVFSPIQELRVPDSLLEIIWLTGNGILFMEPSRDPWYRVTEAFATGSGDIPYLYFQGEAASPLACVSQEQWCNPNLSGKSRCTQLADPYQIRHYLKDIWTDDLALRRNEWISDQITNRTLEFAGIVNVLGHQALGSKYGAMSSLQMQPIPDNQWQLDVEYWLAVMLTSLQTLFVDMPTASSDSVDARIFKDVPEFAKDLVCNNQKILSPAHASFNVAALLLILTIGLLVLVLSLTIEPAYRALMLKRRRNTTSAGDGVGGAVYAYLEWCANETTQMQRLAHEQLGLGTWTGVRDGEVPVTRKGEQLAVLDLKDLEHPRLKAATTAGDLEDGGEAGEAPESECAEGEGRGRVGSGRVELVPLVHRESGTRSSWSVSLAGELS